MRHPRDMAWEWARLLTIMARTSLFLVNLGLWVGSLWGDDSHAITVADVRV